MFLRNWLSCLLSVTAVAVFNVLIPADASAQQRSVCVKVIVAKANVYEASCTNLPWCPVDHVAERNYQYVVESYTNAGWGWWLVDSPIYQGERGWIAQSDVEPFNCPYRIRQMLQRQTKSKA